MTLENKVDKKNKTRNNQTKREASNRPQSEFSGYTIEQFKEIFISNGRTTTL